MARVRQFLAFLCVAVAIGEVYTASKIAADLTSVIYLAFFAGMTWLVGYWNALGVPCSD